GVDAVLLDNMTVEELRKAVAMTGGRAITEASGRITAETAKAIAATGVDLISAGWLTHSSAALDIGLDYVGLNRQEAELRRPTRPRAWPCPRASGGCCARPPNRSPAQTGSPGPGSTALPWKD